MTQADQTPVRVLRGAFFNAQVSGCGDYDAPRYEDFACACFEISEIGPKATMGRREELPNRLMQALGRQLERI